MDQVSWRVGRFKYSLPRATGFFLIRTPAAFTLSEVSRSSLHFLLKITLRPRTREQRKNSSCFSFCLFSTILMKLGVSTPSHQYWRSFRTLTYMLMANQFSYHYFSAPEFWKQEKLHLKSGRSQSSPRDAFSEPRPISGHNNSAHQCGRCGWAPHIWARLLFCGGSWGCGDWNNHPDHFCQGPGCNQQLNQVFPHISPFLHLRIFPSLVSNFPALSPFASLISGDSPF